jgi:hypothetical protein
MDESHERFFVEFSEWNEGYGPLVVERQRAPSDVTQASPRGALTVDPETTELQKRVDSHHRWKATPQRAIFSKTGPDVTYIRTARLMVLMGMRSCWLCRS